MPPYLFRLLQYTAETGEGVIGYNQRTNKTFILFSNKLFGNGEKLTH